MMCDANTLVLILNELEGDDLVVRRRDTVDRRRHIVELTVAGRRALERAERQIQSLEDEILAALSEEERETLYELLSKALEGQVEPAELQTSAAGQISR
jgi:DNA-binding MarR family transcriptional regulator